jgi:hypothetical protein
LSFSGDSSNRIYYREYSSSWSGEYVMGSGESSDHPALTSNGMYVGNEVIMAYRGLSSNSMYTTIYTSTWSSESSVSREDGTSSAPGIAHDGSRLFLVFKGKTSNKIYYKIKTGSSWGNS